MSRIRALDADLANNPAHTHSRSDCGRIVATRKPRNRWSIVFALSNSDEGLAVISAMIRAWRTSATSPFTSIHNAVTCLKQRMLAGLSVVTSSRPSCLRRGFWISYGTFAKYPLCRRGASTDATSVRLPLPFQLPGTVSNWPWAVRKSRLSP